MDRNTEIKYEARANILKAMAHPSRLFMIEELYKQDRSAGELTQMVGFDGSTVSKHLSVLKNAGLVSDRKVGTTVIYTLRTPCVLNFIGCIAEVIEANAQGQMETLDCCRR